MRPAYMRWPCTQEDKWDYEAFVSDRAKAAQSKIAYAQIERGIWNSIMKHRMLCIRAFAKAKRTLSRPSNQDALGLAQFDEQIANIFYDVGRSLPPRSSIPPPQDSDAELMDLGKDK